jgi:exopolyphosphatase/guanosine-5'-triphosphate,3'-diphosphate pyrophosphatase
VDLIGSGGNINKIFKISGKALGKPLTYFYLTSYYNKLQTYSYEERITELELNQDRADVIIPATRIYLSAMKWSGAKDIYVPKIGLSDGIIKSVYYKTVSSVDLALD